MAWTHDEAKEHTLVERLHERCATFAPNGLPCPERPDLPGEDWCERCLAAALLVALGEPS